MKKKTKIIATISDKNCSVEFIKSLYNSGMNVVRINTAHANFEGAAKIIKDVKKVSDKIAILIDTKGPEIRTTAAENEITVNAGDIIKIKGNSNEISNNDCVYVSYNKFVNDIPVGCKILIDDGVIELIAKEKKEDFLLCEVQNSGSIQGKKSINIPSTHIKLPALSKKDINFINFACDNDLDFIAHSFVRKKEDIIAVQAILDSRESNIKIISKIENHEGVKNIDEIIEYSYGIMVARGDLAIEISAEKLPVVQKNIITKCIEQRKPVIVATQMLYSMIKNPRPTRAEVSDIANAIFEGTDAIMLSGETANGKYPIKSVKMMSKIAFEVENNINNLKNINYFKETTDISAYLVKTAVKSSEDLKIRAIIADTFTGRTIRNLAAYRPKCNIFVQCYDKSIMRVLALSYGVYADFMERKNTVHEFVKEALNDLQKEYNFNENDLITIIAGNFGPSKGANYIEIEEIKYLKQKNN